MSELSNIDEVISFVGDEYYKYSNCISKNCPYEKGRADAYGSVLDYIKKIDPSDVIEVSDIS